MKKKFEIGDQVLFTYLKESVPSGKGGNLMVDYETNSETYSGKVVGIRDIVKQPLRQETWKYGKVKNHRSRSLVTLQMANGDVKKFYDGRMLSAKKIEESLTELLSTVVTLAESLATTV